MIRGSAEVSDRPFGIKSPKWLLQGNCILAAIARIFSGSSTPAEILETIDQMAPMWYGSRTYGECIDSVKRGSTLLTTEHFNLGHNRKYLIHADGISATPHCFAAICGVANAEVYNGLACYVITLSQLRRALQESIDNPLLLEITDTPLTQDSLGPVGHNLIIRDLRAGAGNKCPSEISLDEEEVEFTESTPTQRFLDIVRDEVRTYKKRHTGKRCLLCPFRQFRQPSRVVEHIALYHTLANNWCASGFRQLRLAAGIYNSDNVRAVHTQGQLFTCYLQRSAALIRDQCTGFPHMFVEPLGAITNIDRYIRIINYASGPRYCHVEFARKEQHNLRRLGNTFFSRDFYIEAARAALREECRVERVQRDFIDKCASGVASIMPRRIQIWESLLCDIFWSPPISLRIKDLLRTCFEEGEFESISIDCTVKPTKPLVGQGSHNMPERAKREQAVPYSEQIHAIHVARGASGAVLCAEPMFSEKLSPIFNHYRDNFTDEQKGAVRYITSDKVSAEMCVLAREVFPNFRGCALDPLHIVFTVEQATWERKSDLSAGLRRIMSKFSPAIYGAAAVGSLHRGERIKGTKEEIESRGIIMNGGMGECTAKRRLSRIDGSKGYKDREAFCKDVAALVCAYPHLAGQKTRSNNPVRVHLHRITEPGNIEWLLNNERIRRNLSPNPKRILCVGTTGVEALNAELKRWFNGIVELHAPILRLKLRVFALAKLLTFCSSMRYETTVQKKQTHLLSEILSSLDPIPHWGEWCAHHPAVFYDRDTRKVSRPPRPFLMVRREEDECQLSTWRYKSNKPKKKPDGRSER